MEEVVKIKLLKLNLEYLIECLCELEYIIGSESLLKKRAIDIIDYSISQYFNEKNEDNLHWIIDSTIVFLRFYPDNIFSSNVKLLDNEINRLYYFINSIINDLDSLSTIDSTNKD